MAADADVRTPYASALRFLSRAAAAAGAAAAAADVAAVVLISAAEELTVVVHDVAGDVGVAEALVVNGEEQTGTLLGLHLM